jgi:integrase/recombinase XerC
VRQLRLLLEELAHYGATVKPSDTGKPPNPQPRLRTATDEEVDRLYQAAPDHLRLYLHLIGETALRTGEAMKLTPAAYNPDTKTITLQSTKGGKPKTLPVSARAAALLERAAERSPHEPAVTTLSDGKLRATRSVVGAWERLKRKAGVRNDLHPHDLRRTAALRLYKETHDILAVQQLLGHQTVNSTLWYLAPYEPATFRPLLDKLFIPNQRPN